MNKVLLKSNNIFINKRLEIALRDIYGIGKKRASFICSKFGFSFSVRFKDLKKEHKSSLDRFMQLNYNIDFFLKEKVRNDIENLKKVGSYRGIRHKKKYPVRGQRTRTNASSCQRSCYF